MKLPELRIGNLVAKVPIIQGGMAIRLSTARLAAAVANEGGIGLIAASGLPFDELRYEIQLARKLSPTGIIGINAMVAATQFAGLVKTAIGHHQRRCKRIQPQIGTLHRRVKTLQINAHIHSIRIS